MTQEDIIRMAREAGLPEIIDNANKPWAELADFAELIRADEREACAKVIEDYDDHDWGMLMQDECAEAIRARGQA